jgi:hypothetical protein
VWRFFPSKLIFLVSGLYGCRVGKYSCRPLAAALSARSHVLKGGVDFPPAFAGISRKLWLEMLILINWLIAWHKPGDRFKI